MTVNHVLGQKVVLPNSEIIDIGGKYRYSSDIDLNSLFTGSEGTLGIVSEIIVNLSSNPESIRTFLLTFDKLSNASDLVTEILLSGVIPSALEMFDQLCIQAVENHLKIGFPKNASAILIVELDGKNNYLCWKIIARFAKNPQVVPVYSASLFYSLYYLIYPVDRSQRKRLELLVL